MNGKAIEAEVERVEGWLNASEGRSLYRLARACQGRGVIVEVGSWKGKSTIWLGRGSQAGCALPVHAIDPHTGSPEHGNGPERVWTFEEFKQNIRNARLEQLVVPHVARSEAVARDFDPPVELAFIDGLHEYEGVKVDFDSWFPRVVDGGWMAFHDTTCWPGPLNVVRECLFKSRRFRRMRFVSSLTYGQKVAQNTFLERLENRVMLCAFLTHAFIDRLLWRLIHNFLDFPMARAARRWIKDRRRRKLLNLSRV